MIIASEKMKEVYRQALLCAKTDIEVLLLGESGTGKEILARTIHEYSRRARNAFVAINCGSIPAPLVESELFGHERGAFTDAKDTRIGKLEQAHGGTLFLDEVGDLSLEAQAALLRALETKQFTRLGSNRIIESDFRVIAATNKDLARLVREKRFRENLYWRLSVVTLRLPPLRERAEDILPLVDYFLGQLKPKIGRELTLTPAARKKLTLYGYPGHILELWNTIRRAAALCAGERIDEEHITFADDRAEEALEILKTIERCGSVKAAARALGCSRQTLYKKLQGQVRKGWAVDEGRRVTR